MKIHNRTNVQLLIKDSSEEVIYTEFYFSISNAIERALEQGMERCYITFRDYCGKDLRNYIMNNSINDNNPVIVSYIDEDAEVQIITFRNEIDLNKFMNEKQYVEVISVLNELNDLNKIDSCLDFHNGILINNFFNSLTHEEKESMYYSTEDKEIRIFNASKVLIDHIKESAVELDA